METSVVIRVRDGAGTLRAVLDALDGQDEPHRVTAVDQRDHARDPLQAIFARATWGRRGFACFPELPACVARTLAREWWGERHALSVRPRPAGSCGGARRA